MILIQIFCNICSLLVSPFPALINHSVTLLQPYHHLMFTSIILLLNNPKISPNWPRYLAASLSIILNLTIPIVPHKIELLVVPVTQYIPFYLPLTYPPSNPTISALFWQPYNHCVIIFCEYIIQHLIQSPSSSIHLMSSISSVPLNVVVFTTLLKQFLSFHPNNLESFQFYFHYILSLMSFVIHNDY